MGMGSPQSTTRRGGRTARTSLLTTRATLILRCTRARLYYPLTRPCWWAETCHLLSATLRPACEEGSCMDPTCLPPLSYSPRRQTAYRDAPNIDRRTFLAGPAAVLLAAPPAAEAQPAGRCTGSASPLPPTSTTTHSSRGCARQAGSRGRTS